ncbi:uncharacterized protein EDB91DRAFT_1236582 [Suillus paluster]|uniref:uncharacterized protein n=1 Tax=Suillus paluster TaxID=48578 RepID=UPI001B8665A4|nr:uncharacterized protein EDB91DRAFT_1236582 [Suillus paluster]KAG1743994.1 hypothetical protein EDB91DRAFT_1236582 [Suillus paluster]
MQICSCHLSQPPQPPQPCRNIDIIANLLYDMPSLIAYCANEYDFTVNTIDIFTLESSASISQSADCLSPSVALISHGYTGNTPHQPSFAVAIQTLELFCLLRLRKPSLSVEAFAKVIFLRVVEKRVNTELQCDTPNWRVQHACLPYSYVLANEPPLEFGRMYVFDGGNSAKQMLTPGEHQAGDLCVFQDSDYLLPCTFVDGFANKVHLRLDPDIMRPTEADVVAETDDDLLVSVSSQAIAAECSKNWKAAASDEEKRMWNIFDETGIFVCACHHGFILWYANMVQSGELAKYPLSIIVKVLEVLGEHSLGAYDIGCGFSSTIESSSLGPLFKQMDCCMCVDVFHGFVHNYKCQTRHHPHGIKGAGLEDFGMAEHIFSALNALAPIICYASAYNRHVSLDMFFKQWDTKKYLNLAMMIFNNYRQALDIITHETVMLAEAMASLGIMEGDFPLWQQEEVQYFSTLGQELEYNVHAMPSQNSYVAELSHTCKLETQQHYLAEKVDTVQREVLVMEVKMGISQHWEPSSPEYQATMKYMTTQEYHCTLDNLQWLMVQRLFELQRLNVAQTAYKMQTQISKSLQTRCHAIQNAIKKYNEAAAKLEPPQPTLEWSKVSHYQFLDEFTLLCSTCQDISHKEILCCNVEIRRLHSAILDEQCHFKKVIGELEAAGSPLLVVVQEAAKICTLVNHQLLVCITQVYSLPGFTGNPSPGIREGVVAEEDPVNDDLEPHNEMNVPHSDNEGDALEEDDLCTDIGTVVEYISDLAHTSM